MKILNFSKKILLAAMVACTVIGCALAFNGRTVKADEMSDTATIVATEYPSLKINEDGGMRFVIEMNAAAKDYVMSSDDISLVAYIGPVKLFEKTDAEIKETAIRCLLVKDKFYQKTGEADGSWYANACVVKMKDENLAVNYTVKVFVEKTDGTIIKTFAAGEGVRGNIYNIATRALLDETEDYTDKILGLTAYEWLGSEKLPLEIDTLAKYNALVNKVNGGANFADKYIEVYTGIPTEGRATIAEGKEGTLTHKTEYSFVTFLGADGSELAKIKVKSGATAEYGGETPTKAEDENYSYSFAKWVTEQGGETAADLTNITSDTTVYASFDKKGKNAITEFAVEDINYEITPAFTATAKNGTVVIAYSKTEDGTFVSWGELENHDAGTYYVKAFVTETAEYAGAEQVKSFTVKKLTGNAITNFTMKSEIACNETPAPSATATYGTENVKFKYCKFEEETENEKFVENFSYIVYPGIGNFTYYVKAVVEDNGNYDGAESGVVPFKVKHNFVDGVCSICNKTQNGILYGETDTLAYITGYDGNHSLEVYPLATYNGKSVKYVAKEAFANKAITKVVLPESVESLESSAFYNCTNLEFISMSGVTDLTYKSTFVTDGTRDNTFRNCVNLKTVVLNNAFKTNVKQFFADKGKVPETKTLDILLVGGSGEPQFTGDGAIANQNLLTGITYYKVDDAKDAKCLQWNYKNGEVKKGAAKHTLLENGTCKDCGKYGEKLTGGVNYQYDATNSVYYVGLNKTLATAEVNVLGKYNDGMHGEKPVTFVRNGAFSGNKLITKVVLPESITRLDGSVFVDCENLEYVSMLGITDMAFKNLGTSGIYADKTENVITDHNFRGCTKLTVLVVNKEFNLFDNPIVLGATQFVGDTKTVNVYAYCGVDESSVTITAEGATGNNGLLSGNIYYYSESKPTDTEHTYWHYDEKGVATLWAQA